MQAGTMQETSTSPNKTYKVMPIMISLLLSGFIGFFSETALNVALTDLMRDLSVNEATVQWLTTIFLLTLGVLVPVSGMLLQWFTTRQLFVWSLIFSIIGTFVAAIAPNFETLLIARVLQATGTGLLLPLLFNTILVIIPIEKRGAAMGIIGLIMMFAPATGPTFAGILIANLSWHWIFWVSLPFLIISLFVGLVYLQNVSTLTKPRIDILSICLSTLGFGGVVYGFSSAGEGEHGWGSAKVIIAMIVGIVALILFVIRQLKMKEPMINLSTFKYPMFTIGLIMVFICMMVILSSMLILPMYLQRGLMMSPLTVGLLLLPGGLINGFLSPVMGGLFDKYGPKWLVLPGLLVVSVVLWFFSDISTASTTVLIIVLHSLLMIGISMIMMPAQTNGLNQLPPELYPHGTAIMNTLQQVAGAIGTALAVSIMTAGMEKFLKTAEGNPESPANLISGLTVGVQDAFIFAMVVALVGLAIAFFIKRVKVTAAGKQGA